MKNTSFINEFGTFCVILLLASSLTFAQKPKVKTTSKSKTTQTKAKTETKMEQSVKTTPSKTIAIDDSVSAENKAKAEEFFKKGQAHWKNIDINEAIESYTKALELYPNYTAALGERGKIRYLIGERKAAISDLNAYLKLQPNSSEFLYFRGANYAEIAEATLVYEENNETAADYAQLAKTDLDKVLSTDPKNVGALNGRGRLYLNFGFYKEAIADLQKAIGLSGDYFVAIGNLGLAKLYSGEDSGLKEFNRAIELSPSSAESYYNRGMSYRLTGDYEKAIADFTKALKENGLNAKYYNARGMTWFALGNGDKAVNDFSEAIYKKRDFARAFYNRAYTYKKFPASAGGIVEQIRKMREDMDAAIKFNPNFGEAYIERGKNAMGWLPIAINGYKEEDLVKIRAIFADFDKAVKLLPKNAEAYQGRASAYESLGKKDLALADYNKAIELDPDLVTAYMGRMGIYCEQGKKELSIADEKKIKALGYATINVCNLGK